MPSANVPIEQAAKCPKCDIVGQIARANKTKNLKTGETDDIVTYLCVTEHCSWYKTGWVVQSSPRGEVFERDHGERGTDKDFEPMTADQLAYGRMVVEDAANKRLED